MSRPEEFIKAGKARGIFCAVIALALLALGLETSYRAYLWFRYGRHRTQGAALYVDPRAHDESDPLPTRLRPGADLTIKGRRFQIDAPGVRHVPPPKGEARASILFLGGSSVFGPENDDAKAPPAATQWALAEKGFIVRCINAAVPGYTTAEARAWARELLPVFEPDIVVLIEAYNDAKRVAASAMEPMDYGRWRTWSKERWAVPPWWRRSDLFDRLLRRPRSDWNFAGQPEGTFTYLPTGYADPYLREISELAREVGGLGGLFGYGAQPTNLNQDGAAATVAAHHALAIHLWPLAPQAGARAVTGLIDEALAARAGQPTVDLRPAFLGRPALFVDHVHLSDEGAALWGKTMAEGLLGLGPVAQRLGITY